MAGVCLSRVWNVGECRLQLSVRNSQEEKQPPPLPPLPKLPPPPKLPLPPPPPPPPRQPSIKNQEKEVTCLSFCVQSNKAGVGGDTTMKSFQPLLRADACRHSNITWHSFHHNTVMLHPPCAADSTQTGNNRRKKRVHTNFLIKTNKINFIYILKKLKIILLKNEFQLTLTVSFF